MYVDTSLVLMYGLLMSHVFAAPSSPHTRPTSLSWLKKSEKKNKNPRIDLPK
jgi:hypothetical protein